MWLHRHQPTRFLDGEDAAAICTMTCTGRQDAHTEIHAPTRHDFAKIATDLEIRLTVYDANVPDMVTSFGDLHCTPITIVVHMGHAYVPIAQPPPAYAKPKKLRRCHCHMCPVNHDAMMQCRGECAEPLCAALRRHSELLGDNWAKYWMRILTSMASAENKTAVCRLMNCPIENLALRDIKKLASRDA